MPARKIKKKKKDANLETNTIDLKVESAKTNAKETTQEISDLTKPLKVKKIKLDKIDWHSKKLRHTMVIIAIVLPTFLIGIYYYIQYINTQNELIKFRQNPQAAAMRDLVQKVASHTDLPINETPTIATITDADKLKTQPFFSRAQNGDKLLIYQNAQRTILYRPTTDRIIETLAAKIDNVEEITKIKDTSESTPSLNNADKEVEKNEAPVEITIYNGTRISGLASSARNKFNKEFDTVDLEVVGIGDAANTYENTLVIPLTPLGELKAQELADFIGGTIQKELPGENPAESDLVIILGLDSNN